MQSRLAILFSLLAACASSPAGSPASATIDGTLDGVAVPAAVDAIAFNKNGNLTVKLTDYAGACDLEEMNNAHEQGSHYLELYLTAYPGATGTYVLGEDDVVDASYFTRDATCGGAPLSAKGGSIVISSITADRVAGSFALELESTSGTTNHLTGTFDAMICGDGTPAGTGGACVPQAH